MGGQRWMMFIVTFVLTVVLLSGNIFVQSQLDDIIQEEQLIDAGYIEGAPPMVAFTTVALGGFRGILADVLWLRSITLKEEGKFYELAQVASWIVALQPKSTAAAAYQGWNMAYNISATCRTVEDRWNWIHRGIEVFWQALRTNPNDPLLYKELGWIYQHKMGDVMDEAQRDYKYKLGNIYLKVYGSHYPDWQAIGDAPRTEAELRERFPANHSLWKILEAYQYPNLNKLQIAFREKGSLPPELEVFPPALQNNKSVMPLTEEDLALLTNYFRSKWLREVFALDPKYIIEIEKKFGELDWLLAESVAIYWAYLGLENSPNKADVNCERMITQSLQVNFFYGRMLFSGDTVPRDFLLIPNLSLADAARKAMVKAKQENPDVLSFDSALGNFYKNAIVTLYQFGQESKAREFYNYFCKEYPERYNGNGNMKAFISSIFVPEMTNAGFKRTGEYIASSLFRGCLFLAYDQQDEAESNFNTAKFIYDEYHRKNKDERRKFPTFRRMRNELAFNLLNTYFKDKPVEAERLREAILAEDPKAFDPVVEEAEPVKYVVPD